MTNGGNGITISARLVERLLLGALVVAVGGSSVLGVAERNTLNTDIVEVCGEIQELRSELAVLFSPFLDIPSEGPENSSDRAGRAALQRVVDRLDAPHKCP